MMRGCDESSTLLLQLSSKWKSYQLLGAGSAIAPVALSLTNHEKASALNERATSGCIRTFMLGLR